jgi:hypothetical protein
MVRAGLVTATPLWRVVTPGNESGGPVDPDAPAPSAAGVAWNRYVDGARVRLEHSPDCGGAAVADDGLISDGEYGRHTPALKGEPGVADGVNTAMKSMQPAGLDAPGDAVVGDTCGRKLTTSHHPMLVRGDSSDQLLAIGAFLAHSASNAPDPSLRPLTLSVSPFVADVRTLPRPAGRPSPSLPMFVRPTCGPRAPLHCRRLFPRRAAEWRPL